ncbi:YceH family protein [Comamonas endophytica]|uniref:YceH family protein n=1 Tax=Comamonas endophytica TaxID=2949090 RepID=A0ABY6GDX6_9BURK|nr:MULTISPECIES: YceH family protein [unclassified Acidovorax]MCD2513109.1 YceH family protein [Acidovorax sp. D4N7]UYG52552.1 YceH family protein [Acidovorax sp. 5MLIR]
MPFDPRSTPLNPVQARVLATLMEKARTVPDSYPLSLNALLSGCNQKSSRDPVMELSESDAQQALDDLLRMSLVTPVSGSRTQRWEHNFPRGVGVPEQSAVLLALLLLRGPQTAAELRLNAERWHRFADISSVEAFLDELQERSEEKGSPLVVLLPRAPGAREPRWASLLCGPIDLSALPSAPTARAAAGSGSEPRIAALEAQVQQLQAQLDALYRQLGIEPEGAQTGD